MDVFFFFTHFLYVKKTKNMIFSLQFFFGFEHTIFFATTKYRNVRMRPLNNLLDFLSLFFSWQLKLQTTATNYPSLNQLDSRKISQNFSLYVLSHDHGSKFVFERKKKWMYVFFLQPKWLQLYPITFKNDESVSSWPSRTERCSFSSEEIFQLKSKKEEG